MKSIFRLTILFLLVVNSISTFAQTNSRISGSVFDEKTKEAVEQASIRVLNVRDSSFVAGAITNESGNFQVQVKQGKYILNISYLGYAAAYVDVNANQDRVSVGQINMKEDAILLQEAVVIGKAVEIMVKGDTIEYNADSYKVQESAVLEDLMKKMPGVEIDSDGKITVNGKEVKKILVDGKEFFSDDPKIASKNLPASMVNKLQVVDKKSDMAMMTGFDDGNEETVINLSIKPGMKEGAFGNAYAGYGNKDRYETNAMISYLRDNKQLTVLGGTNNTNNAGFSDFASSSFGGMRPPRGLNFGNRNGIMTSTNGGVNFATETSPKFKWGGNARYGGVDNDVESRSYTQSIDPENGDSFETKEAWGTNKSYNTGANLRFEWSPDSMTQIIFTPNLQYNKNKNWQATEFLTTKEDSTNIINSGNSNYYMEGSGLVLNGTIDFSRKLNNEGRVFSMSFSGGINNSESEGTNQSKTDFYQAKPNEELNQLINNDVNSHNWRAFASYVEPIGRNNFLQLTYSYRKNYSKSDKITRRAEDLEIDEEFTKLTKNDFTNQQIGLNFKSVREKFNYTLGFEVQPSSSKTESTNIDTIIRVTNFSPSAQFNYIWSRNSNLRISYSGVTNQPSATQLSVAKDKSDALNSITGNPNLKPSFENRLNIRYRKFNPEQASAFMIFGRFSYTLDDIVNISTIDSVGAKLSTYDNVDGNFSGNMRMIYNTPLNFNKKFSINSMSFASYSQQKGMINSIENISKNLTFQESFGIEYRSDIFDAGLRGNFTYNNIRNTSREEQTTYIYGGNLNTTIYLPYNFTLESDVNYSANSGYSDGFKQNEWLWNASLAKSIFKNKAGTLRFKIYDILQQRSNVSRSSSHEYISDITTNSINSYFMFHFVYKFQLFKGGVKQSDMEDSMRGGRGMRGGRSPHHM